MVDAAVVVDKQHGVHRHARHSQPAHEALAGAREALEAPMEDTDQFRWRDLLRYRHALSPRGLAANMQLKDAFAIRDMLDARAHRARRAML